MSGFKNSPLGYSMTLSASTELKLLHFIKEMNQMGYIEGYIEVGEVYYLEKFVKLTHHLVVKKGW